MSSAEVEPGRDEFVKGLKYGLGGLIVHDLVSRVNTDIPVVEYGPSAIKNAALGIGLYGVAKMILHIRDV